MPGVEGMSKQAAVARLDALGLDVAIYAVPGSDAAVVVSQEPAAGTTVRYGDTVTIYVA
jgi:beta-lactam-binding protein with PASTA domain